MLVKAVLIFLVAMVVIAWVGRLLTGSRSSAVCPACKRPRVGPGPCACGRA